MTADEFERVMTSLKHTQMLNIHPLGLVLPYRAVVEILISNLHQEDRACYQFDPTTYEIRKRPPS